MLNFDRFIVKHGTQDIQNNCHQWLSGSFKVHQIRFRPGLRLGPYWGSAVSSPRPSSWFIRPYFELREGLKGKEKGREDGKRKGTGGVDPHFANSVMRL